MMDIIKHLSEYEKVIIYGAGVVGRTVVEKLIYKNPEINIVAVAVTEKKENPDMILKIPVVCITDLSDIKSESIVLVATMEEKHEIIRKYLKELGFKNVCVLNNRTYDEWKNNRYYQRYVNPYIKTVRELCEERNLSICKREEYVKKALEAQRDQFIVNIPRLVVVLGTKCSLRCKECNNLMPYFAPQKDLDINTIIRSLNILLRKANTILRCELIGGEPFLSKNLDEIIKFLIDKENIYQIEITTNGTLLPDTELIPVLRNSKIKVRISDYGELVKKERIVQFLQRNEINYQILESGYWISPGGIEKRGRNEEKLRKYYNSCIPGYYCKTLFDGRIFNCARAASLYALGYMKEKDFIDINEDITIDEIKEFWIKDYSMACDYCDITIEDKVYVTPAVQL